MEPSPKPAYSSAASRRLRIALDLDCVLADSESVFLDELNKRKSTAPNGTVYVMEDLTDFSFQDSRIPINREEFLDMWNYVWENRWQEIKANIKEPELAELMEHYDVEIVTAISPTVLSFVALWLNNNYPGINIGVTRSGSKEKFSLGFNFYIDDGVFLADQFLLSGPPQPNGRLYLRERPWNANTAYRNSPHITPVKDLGDAVSRVLAPMKKPKKNNSEP